MERLLSGALPSLRELSPLTLAFLGDGVYELMVREHLLQRGSCPAGRLHARTVQWVCCEAQAQALEDIFEGLTQEERALVLRGRNAHPGHVPKNSTAEAYHSATALETLFGALYAVGGLERLRELFGVIVSCRAERNLSAE